MSSSLFAVVIVLSSILHFSVQRVFIYYKRFDDINHRSSHKTLATRTGGIGVFISLFLVSLFYYSQGVEIFDYTLFVPLGIMLIVGVYDDLYKADFKLKFLLQIIVAKIIIDQGYVISNFYGLFGLYEIPWIIAQIVTVFVFLIIVNSINFVDGIDGLAISQVIKTILLIEFLSKGLTSISNLGFLISISIIPLYYFNFKSKRKIFLGDGGSLFLGTTIAIYCFFVLGKEFEFKNNLGINKTIFSILVIFYPLIDLLRVFVIRIINKKSPFYPDQNHIHHLLISKFSHLKTLLIIIFSELILIFIIYKMFL